MAVSEIKDDIVLHLDVVYKSMVGIQKLENAVKVTLGPKGRIAFIQDGQGGLIATKDGVTVASYLCVEDELEDAAINIVRQASEETVKKAGDGTTSAIVVASAILKEAIKLLASGVHSEVILKGLSKGAGMIVAELRRISRPVNGMSDVRHVAYISANEAKLGEIISQAIELQLSGKIGGITVTESADRETSIEISEGLKLESGYVSSGFVNVSSKMMTDLTNPFVLLSKDVVDNITNLVPVLELAAKSGRGLLLIASDFSEEVISVLLTNKTRAGLNVCAIKMTAFQDEVSGFMSDVGLVLGATVIGKDSGKLLVNMNEAWLGTAERVYVTKDETTIIGGQGDKTAIRKQGEWLKNKYDLADGSERKTLEQRISVMCQGVGIIKVGASTEAFMREQKDRIDDALHAARAAVLGGVVPGGGVALLRASSFLEGPIPSDVQMVVNILRYACRAGLIIILQNCGVCPGVILDKLINSESKSSVYDGNTDLIVDCWDAGIIDPLLVVESVILNAVSAACAIISSGAAIIKRTKVS